MRSLVHNTECCRVVIEVYSPSKFTAAHITLHLLLFIAHKHNLNNQATSAVQDTELNSYRTYFVLTFLAGLHDKTLSAIDSTLPRILCSASEDIFTVRHLLL